MARFGEINAQYFDDAGDPLSSGKIYFYETGTTTLKDTFSDINQTIANTNPVILTAAGRQPNIFFSGTAKAILVDKNDVQILVRDPVGQTASVFGDGWVATKIYSADAVVLGSDGQYYRSLAAGNQNNDPTSTSGYWTLLYSVEWNAGITYQVGAVVSYNNIQYQSLQNSNLNNNPSSATAYWASIAFAWLSTRTYSIHENVVGTDGILYTSLQNNNTGNVPASSGSYWVGTSAAAAASATAAATSATAAATSATNAATSETNAANSATAAATSATNAATSATNSANSATASATSATNSATSATASANSATASASSATDAANKYDEFDDRYLGQKTSDPLTDNDGNALVTGAIYFNTTTNVMRVYNGSAWQDVAPIATSITLSQVSDVTATAAEVNLNDGSVAGTIVNGKTVVYGASGEVNATTLQVGGTAITSTPQELNVLDGIPGTLTATELGYVDGVTSAIQTQIDAKATYPSQGGNAGKFLTTNGSAVSWAAAGGAGTGGATTACPATLTSSSDSAHILTATTWGAVLTLPDATTMDESLPTFGFYNQSHYDIPIENTSGVLLGYVLAGDSTMCSLIDNSTAAGTWRFSNPQPLGTYAAIMDLAPQTQSVSLWGYERVTASKWMVCYQLGSYMYARVYNESNRTWGSAVLVHSKGSNGYIGIQKVADDKMILAYSYSGAADNWARVASVSGETITLGTEDTESTGPMSSNSGYFYKLGANAFVAARKNSNNQIDLIGYTVSGTTVTSGSSYQFGCRNFILRPIGNTGQDTGFVVVGYDGSGYTIQTFYVNSSNANVTNIAGTTLSSTHTEPPSFVSNQTTNGNLLFFYESNTGAPRGMCVKATSSNVTVSTGAASSPALAFNPDGPIGYLQDGNFVLLIFESDSSNYISGLMLKDVSGTLDIQADNWVANEGAMMIGEGSDGIYALSSHPNRKDGYMHRYFIDSSNPQEVPNREYVEYFYQQEFANVNYFFSWYGNRFDNGQKIEVGRTDTFAKEFGGSTYQVNGRNFTLESARYRTITRQEGGGFAKGVFDKTANQVISIDARRTSFKQEYGVGYNNTSLADCAQGWDVWAEQNTDTPSNEYYVQLTLRRLADA